MKFRYLLDNLSGIMLLVVTGVGTLIHVYSTGYMSHDDGRKSRWRLVTTMTFRMSHP